MTESRLWPPISPFRQDFLQVSRIHRIRYALYGNPDGPPVFFLHGGPGSGCSDEDARWFDPGKFLVVTHDQRGSGKSLPRAEIKDNTPQKLVEDLEHLRRHLGIGAPVSIFAGSWGTTLALLYAQAFPHNVSRMILRGIFTCGWEEQDYFYSEKGAARFSPAAWERLVSRLPPGPQRIQERLHRAIETADAAEREKWYRLLAEYEYSFFDLPPQELKQTLADLDAVLPELRINMFYQAHRFFLEDNQILDNTARMAHIPVTLIHGARDVICPPAQAWQLHRRLPESTLTLISEAAHLSADRQIRQALLEAVRKWE